MSGSFDERSRVEELLLRRLKQRRAEYEQAEEEVRRLDLTMSDTLGSADGCQAARESKQDLVSALSNYREALREFTSFVLGESRPDEDSH